MKVIHTRTTNDVIRIKTVAMRGIGHPKVCAVGTELLSTFLGIPVV